MNGLIDQTSIASQETNHFENTMFPGLNFMFTDLIQQDIRGESKTITILYAGGITGVTIHYGEEVCLQTCSSFNCISKRRQVKRKKKTEKG